MIQIKKMRDVLYSHTNFSFSSVYIFFTEHILGMLGVLLAQFTGITV